MGIEPAYSAWEAVQYPGYTGYPGYPGGGGGGSGGGGGGGTHHHHGGIQSPMSTSTQSPQCPQFPCPGPGIHGMSGPCGFALATPAQTPSAVRPTAPAIVASATIFFSCVDMELSPDSRTDRTCIETLRRASRPWKWSTDGSAHLPAKWCVMDARLTNSVLSRTPAANDLSRRFAGPRSSTTAWEAVSASARATRRVPEHRSADYVDCGLEITRDRLQAPRQFLCNTVALTSASISSAS
jgi:hypothetical protein